MGNAKGTRKERRAAAIAQLTPEILRWIETARSLTDFDLLVLVASDAPVSVYLEWKGKQELEKKS